VRLPEGSIYQPIGSGVRARAQAGQQGAMPAETFVVPVVDALLRNPPPLIVRGGTNSRRLPLLSSLLPTSAFDSKLSKMFGLDKLR
jgi:hypothetical protein